MRHILRYLSILPLYVGLYFYSSCGIALNSFYLLNGQSTGLVYTVYQGKDSFWIGGENGLFRVTGAHTKFFSSSEPPFHGMDIEGVVEDKGGRIWITTFGRGVIVFEPRTNTFELIDTNSGLYSEYCLTIAIHAETIALNCIDSLTIINTKSHEIINITDIEGEKLVNISDVKIDGLGNIYILHEKNLLSVGRDNNLIRVVSSKSDFEVLKNVDSFNIDSRNTLWFSSSNELFYFKDNTINFSARFGKSTPITKIVEYELDSLLIFSDIFYLLNTETQKVERLNNISNSLRVRIEDIYSHTVTNFGDIVFSAPLLGVASLNGLSLSIDRMLPSVNSSINIQATLAHQDLIYIAYGNDLYIYNLTLQTIELIANDIGIVTGIELDRLNNNLILGVVDKGLLKISLDSEHYRQKLLFKIEAGVISDVKMSENRDLYFGLLESSDDGLYYLEKNKSPEKLLNIEVDSITETKSGNLYVSTRNNGVIKLDKSYQGHNSQKQNFINNCLLEDSDGVIWICTDGAGLGYLDEDTQKIVFIDSKYTANSRHIRELVQDTDGFFWVMTNQGLVRYDHRNKSSIKLGKEDGISDVDFEITASINLPNNKILVAGDTQNYIIDTKIANSFLNRRSVKTTDTIIVDFKVLGTEAQGPTSRKAFLMKSLDTGEPIEIAHDELYFDVEFAANNFVDRKILSFQYRLMGLDPNWITTTPNNSSATYSTLPSGDYEFQVRTIDPKSMSLQPISSLKISVLPPYWQTWQAYIIYVLILIASTIAFFKYRTIKMAKTNTRLEGSIMIRSSDLAQSQNSLAETLAHKEALYAHASHELRTPLTLISGPIQQLSKVLTNKSALDNLEIVKRNSNRLSRLVDQILELSKIDSVKSGDLVVYQLKDSIDSIVESFKPALAAKNQTLVFENKTSGTALFTADSLEKIISNLLSNAIKYSRSDGTVHVDVNIWKQQLLLSIKDNGIGIAKPDLESIFDRYMRVGNAEDIDGSGLGLAVVKELVAINHGSIQVESDLGKGTVFRISLPIDLKSTAKSEKSASSTVMVNRQVESVLDTNASDFVPAESDIDHELTVLIVEDQNDMQTFLTGLLKDKYSCENALNGIEGYNKATSLIPNLVLTDLMMPSLDGFELTKQLRDNPLTCHIPIIMLTAKSDDSTRLMGWKNHVDDFISKPFDNEELIARIDNLLSIRRNISKKFADPDESKHRDLFVLEKGEYYRETERRFFTKFVDWLAKNYSDEQIKRRDAADALAVSERQLTRKLSALTNSSFNDLLRKYRLTKAQALLKSGRQITQVAYETGFSSPSYFSNCFKEEFGKSPKAYIESI